MRLVLVHHFSYLCGIKPKHNYFSPCMLAMNQQLWACSNSMSLDIWEGLKWKIFTWTLNTDQMPTKKDNCREIVLNVYIGEGSKDLAVGNRFLDCMSVITGSSNSAEPWVVNPKFVTERSKLH